MHHATEGTSRAIDLFSNSIGQFTTSAEASALLCHTCCPLLLAMFDIVTTSRVNVAESTAWHMQDGSSMLFSEDSLQFLLFVARSTILLDLDCGLAQSGSEV